MSYKNNNPKAFSEYKERNRIKSRSKRLPKTLNEENSAKAEIYFRITGGFISQSSKGRKISLKDFKKPKFLL